MSDSPYLVLNAERYPDLYRKYLQEVDALNNLPLNINNAPVLILTKAGEFELAWSPKKTTLLVWVSHKTWGKIWKIIKQDSATQEFQVDELKKDSFLRDVRLKYKEKKYLGSYPYLLSEKLIKVQEKSILENNNFGKWVELAYLLPSFIPLRFGPELQLVENYEEQNYLRFAMSYADEVRKFFNQRGNLIGYGAGDSGLWLNGDSIYTPARQFNLIWGLGGRADFFLKREDNEIECCELKTKAPNKIVQDPTEQLVKIDALRQLIMQAPAQLLYTDEFALLPVTKLVVLGVGCNATGNIISWAEEIPPLTEEEKIIECHDSLNTGVLARSVRTQRLVQLAQKFPEPKRKRFEIAAEIVGQSANVLINNLVNSDEWDAIHETLNKYHERKYKNISLALPVI